MMDATGFDKGFAFPMDVDPQGRIAESSGDRKVRESIRMILGTQQGERLMRPTYGSRLWSLAFEPNTATTANLARFYVEDALRRWEPRIRVGEVVVEARRQAGGDSLAIRVGYKVVATGLAADLAFVLPLQ